MHSRRNIKGVWSSWNRVKDEKMAAAFSSCPEAEYVMNEMMEASVGSEKTIANKEERIMTSERIYLFNRQKEAAEMLNWQLAPSHDYEYPERAREMIPPMRRA